MGESDTETDIQHKVMKGIRDKIAFYVWDFRTLDTIDRYEPDDGWDYTVDHLLRKKSWYPSVHIDIACGYSSTMVFDRYGRVS